MKGLNAIFGLVFVLYPTSEESSTSILTAIACKQYRTYVALSLSKQQQGLTRPPRLTDDALAILILLDQSSTATKRFNNKQQHHTDHLLCYRGKTVTQPSPQSAAHQADDERREASLGNKGPDDRQSHPKSLAAGQGATLANKPRTHQPHHEPRQPQQRQQRHKRGKS